MPSAISTHPLILGIDPGLSGAFAFYNIRTKTCELFDMPRSTDPKKGHLLDAHAIGEILDGRARHVMLAVVEDVGAHKISGRTQGTVSMFNFGVSKGIVLGALGSYQIPIRMAGLSWKVSMGLSRDKNLSRTRAAELIPSISSQLKRKKDDGRAEAALLAIYGAAGLSRL